MMATRSSPPPRPTPRLYLATPALSATEDIAAALADALAAADVAAVLVRLQPADDRTLINQIKALAPLVQKAGAAVVIEGHVELSARSGADGAQVSGVEALAAALPQLKPDRICGASGLLTRHDAMVAGESGADYVLFGEPDAEGHRPAVSAVAERIAWWAEVFEPPCVAYACTLDEVHIFAAAGADFVLLAPDLWCDRTQAAHRVAAAAALLAGSSAATP